MDNFTVKISAEDFKNAMSGIYTSNISFDTLNKCLMAYKNPNETIDNIKDTVDIIKHIVPVYNFKGSKKKIILCNNYITLIRGWIKFFLSLNF